MKKAVILARVSTTRQEEEGLSLDNQKHTLLEYAKKQGFEVTPERTFVFSETADNKARRKFYEVVDLVKASGDLVAIISFRVDRTTRNFRDAVLFDDLRLEYGKELHFVHDRLVLNKNSVGRDIQDWDLKVFLAKQFLNRLKEDAQISALHKLRNGELPGCSSFGYRNSELPDGKKTVVIDPYKSKVVQAAYNLYSTGAYSLLTLRQKLEEEFNLKITKSQINDILKNPFYFGEILWKESLYPHRYETLITKRQFDKVQSIKASYGKQRFKYAGLPYSYRGLIRCATCGCLITPERSKGHIYYHCTQSKGKHGASYLREEELTKQLADIFKGMQIPDKVLTELATSLKQSHDAKSKFQESIRINLEAEYKKYQNRIERMYEDKLDGSITDSEYAKKYSEFREQQDKIKVKLDTLEYADKDYYLTTTYLLQLANKAPELFEKAEPEQKRLFIKFALQNLTLEGKKLHITAKKPFDLMASCANNENWLRGPDSNRRPIG